MRKGFATPMNPFSLSGGTALVTGSTQGIGRAIALGIAAAGAEVVFHGNTARPADLPSGAAFVPGDLLDERTPAALVAAAVRERPGLDLLVCNAGSFFDVPFLEMDAARWDRTMDLNARAAYFTVQAFARGRVERRTDREGARRESDAALCGRLGRLKKALQRLARRGA